MKRDPLSGSAIMAAPTTLAYSNNLYVNNLPPIPHNLGYPPAYRYYYEPFQDGTIWPSLTGRTDGNAQNPTHLATTGPGIIAWVDSTNLYIQLFSNAVDSPFTGNFKVYYVIYRDFSLV